MSRRLSLCKAIYPRSFISAQLRFFTVKNLDLLMRKARKSVKMCFFTKKNHCDLFKGGIEYDENIAKKIHRR